MPLVWTDIARCTDRQGKYLLWNTTTCLKRASRELQESFKRTSRELQENIKSIKSLSRDSWEPLESTRELNKVKIAREEGVFGRVAFGAKALVVLVSYLCIMSALWRLQKVYWYQEFDSILIWDPGLKDTDT